MDVYAHTHTHAHTHTSTHTSAHPNVVGSGVALPEGDRAFQLEGDASLEGDIIIQGGAKVLIDGRGSTITTGG